MEVKIDKNIAHLYLHNNLSYEVSLNWILGYIQKEYSKQIPKELFNKHITEYVLQDIDKSIIEQIYIKFNSEINIDAAVNFLCTMAFSLGGEE